MLMNSGLSEIFYPFKRILIICLIVLFILLSYVILRNGFYDQNLFEIKLNDVLMVGNYTEKISNNILIKFDREGNNYTNKSVNRVSLQDNMLLQINEYEVYNEHDRRVPGDDYWVKLDDFIYKEVNYSKIRLEIKKSNQILYNGNYIENITPYINETGRYYIHIYINRKDGWFSGVKTHFSFNVIVGDQNE